MRQVTLVLGVLVCLMEAFLMFNGSIMGERTTGIATIVGIIGIGIISSSRKQKEDSRLT